MSKINTKLKEDLIEVKKEVGRRTFDYVVTAFGLVAGLAWNDAIKSLIEYLFPQNQNGVKAKLIYAIFITLVMAVVSYYVAKFSREDGKDEKRVIKKSNKKLKNE
jgi:hypothetical protein